VDVLALRDVYPDDARDVSDVTWIADAATHGFVVFTANPAIASVAHERAAIVQHGTKVFCIANVQHTREGRALIYGRYLLAIIRRSKRPGPCFWRLAPDHVTRDIP
jgi:hypothetical protein